MTTIQNISGLRPLLWITDIGFVAYWSVTALGLLPPAWAYLDYRNPMMVAWNWSFAPLDLLASALGFSALSLMRRGDDRAWPALVTALTLTSCAGLQTLSFWAIRRDFDISWWIPNAFLMLYPLWMLPKVGRIWAQNFGHHDPDNS